MLKGPIQISRARHGRQPQLRQTLKIRLYEAILRQMTKDPQKVLRARRNAKRRLNPYTRVPIQTGLRPPLRQTLKIPLYEAILRQMPKDPQKVLRGRRNAKICVWLKTKGRSSASKSSFTGSDSIVAALILLARPDGNVWLDLKKRCEKAIDFSPGSAYKVAEFFATTSSCEPLPALPHTRQLVARTRPHFLPAEERGL